MVVYSKYFYSTDHVGFMSESSAVSTTPAPGRESGEEQRESQKTPSTGTHLLPQCSLQSESLLHMLEMKDYSNITQKNEIKNVYLLTYYSTHSVKAPETSNVTLLNTFLSSLFVFI